MCVCYSVVSLQRPTGSYTVAGAPRYNHIGRAVFLGRDPQTQQWAVRQTIDGEQIGSYFGAELCSVDLEGDGWTDLLLVGAPLYHETDIGGLVSVCQISPQGNASCPSALRGQAGQTLGRFGSAISALGDLNGDGLTDVAVGAPLEDGHRGSVYIYHGTEGGIAPSYSQ
ncbi:integrin alpha-M-like, partial [Rhincodon typus]|uniref:integrin alpha-M-like n=1 Tax=Rhincodon typus TaxID=259920 RepID=UPI00202EFD59